MLTEVSVFVLPLHVLLNACHSMLLTTWDRKFKL